MLKASDFAIIDIVTSSFPVSREILTFVVLYTGIYIDNYLYSRSRGQRMSIGPDSKMAIISYLLATEPPFNGPKSF